MYKIKDNHLYINGERLPFRLNTEIIDETNLAFGFVCATYEGFYNIKTINKSNELADYITLDLDKDKYMPHFKIEPVCFKNDTMQEISMLHGIDLNEEFKTVTIIIPKENIALKGVFEKELKLRQLKNQMNKIEKDFE